MKYTLEGYESLQNSKGVFRISPENDLFYIKTASETLDITELLSERDRMYINHTGLALGICDGKGWLNVCKYFNYHVHSRYSILDAMTKVKTLAEKSSGISALSEHGNMFSFLEWQKAMTKEGKKPVFAFEAYVESAKEVLSSKGLERALSESVQGEKEGAHLILIAVNQTGLKNLFELSTKAYDNFYKKPHVSLNMLKEHSEGIACTSACLSGEVARLLRSDDYDGAKKIAQFYKAVFKDNYYLEIQRHNITDEDKVNEGIQRLSRELDIKILAANDSHWEKESDEKAHDYLLCVRYNRQINTPDHPTFDGDGYEYFSDEAMIDRFWDMPEIIKNGLELAERCNASVKTGEYHVPKFPLPEGYSEEQYLSMLADEGFKKRYGEGTEELKNRLDYEKSVINQMGYAGYFLIVWDYVSWAKAHGIYVGPGRGSAVGSVLSYCLGITDLEPTKYGLMFERFLNPERVSMPDIDIDFDFERRQEVIEYVKEKYGADCVCNIITFGTMAAKQAVKDVARAEGNYPLGDQVSKMITEGKLKDALDTPELAAAYSGNSEIKKLIDVALELEGMPRQTGVHACGVVISDKPIKNYMPMAMVKDNKAEEKGLPKDTRMLCTQVTMSEVEELGCLKMDFLGLRTMTVLRKAIESINVDRKNRGLREIENYRQLPLNNPYVYMEIGEGRTQALFQIESDGMRALMREMFGDVKDTVKSIEEQYSCKGFLGNCIGDGDKAGYLKRMSEYGDELFERMIAAISLYRPGPMDYIPDYENGLKNPEGITYDTPLLEPILKNTYGVMVYQEQVMQTVKALAGFSNAQADTIRKAMGKKKQEILDEYKPYFLNGSGDAIDEHTGRPLNIKGCVASGVSEDVASAVWDKMKDFAKYAFNKSHAAGYAVITVTSAWLKHYYPVHFMCATLNSYIDNNAKLKGYLSATRKMGINILPPSINSSSEGFNVEGDSIRFGFMGIKGLSKTVTAIVSERENGFYTSLQNFAERVPEIKNYEALVKAGCFDEFGFSRKALCDAVPHIKDSIKKKSKETKGQMSFFDEIGVMDEVEIEKTPEWTTPELLEYEKEVTELYLSEHPLDQYRDILKNMSDISLLEKGECSVGVIITDYTIKYTKKDNRPMASVSLEDQTGEIKGVIFPDDYSNLFGFLKKDNVVVVRGTVKEDEDFGRQIIIKNIVPVESMKSDETVERIYVKLNGQFRLKELDNILAAFPGNTEVFAQCDEHLFKMNLLSNPCSALFMTLQNEFDDVIYKSR